MTLVSVQQNLSPLWRPHAVDKASITVLAVLCSRVNKIFAPFSNREKVFVVPTEQEVCKTSHSKWLTFCVLSYVLPNWVRVSLIMFKKCWRRLYGKDGTVSQLQLSLVCCLSNRLLEGAVHYLGFLLVFYDSHKTGFGVMPLFTEIRIGLISALKKTWRLITIQLLHNY